MVQKKVDCMIIGRQALSVRFEIQRVCGQAGKCPPWHGSCWWRLCFL